MSARRIDHDLIARMIPQGSRVLDVGCGDGTLMALLRDERGADARGIELSDKRAAQAMTRGLPVVQGNADTDLADYPSDSFDAAVLSLTLQATHAPEQVLRHLLRVSRRAIVSFPNFGHWRIRLSLLLQGRMPVTGVLPVAWYATENIHLCTIRDFQDLVEKNGFRVTEKAFLSRGRKIPNWGANWRAEAAIFSLRRKD